MKATKRILAVLLVLALGLALFVPMAQGLFLFPSRFFNPGIPGIISPSINWPSLLYSIFADVFGFVFKIFFNLFLHFVF